MKNKSKENSLLFAKSKKIEILKNIYINLKCIKTKEDNKKRSNYKKDRYQTNKNSFVEKMKKKKDEKNNKNKTYKSKSKKNFYSNSNNNSMKKCNTYFRNRKIKKSSNNIHSQSITNNMSKSQNNIIHKKLTRNNNNSSKTKKVSVNDNKIYQKDPLELTFGNSSFMSNIQTEANNIEKTNNKNKNKTFLVSINNNKNIKGKKEFIRHNKIMKLKRKIFFDPNWKIKQKDNNKSEIIIKNYKTKKKYEFINNHYTNININYREKNYHSVNISNEIRKNNRKIKIRNNNERINNNLIKNKILKNRNEKEKYKNEIRKNHTTKNSAIGKKNALKKIKSCNNNKEYIIRININDKENGRYKLIIKRTNNYKKRMPKSTPKLFLAHPSLKNLFL